MSTQAGNAGSSGSPGMVSRLTFRKVTIQNPENLTEEYKICFFIFVQYMEIHSPPANVCVGTNILGGGDGNRRQNVLFIAKPGCSCSTQLSTSKSQNGFPSQAFINDLKHFALFILCCDYGKDRRAGLIRKIKQMQSVSSEKLQKPHHTAESLSW